MQGILRCAGLGVVLALLLMSTAQADIRPIPRPQPQREVAPLPKAQLPVEQAVPQPSVQRQRATSVEVATSGAPARVPAPAALDSIGGREQPPIAPVVSTGGRAAALRGAPVPAQRIGIVPTALAEVHSDPLPGYDTWPSWVLAAVALLGTAEAFLLVRVARDRRFQRSASLR